MKTAVANLRQAVGAYAGLHWALVWIDTERADYPTP